MTLAAESLAKEFYQMFKKDLVESMTNSLENITEMNRKFEDMKKEFFYEINTQGKYHIMKEKMKKSIVRIVREHFKRDDPSFRGLSKDQRDHFYSKLYEFLVDKMRSTVKSLVARKRNELHDNIVIPQE